MKERALMLIEQARQSLPRNMTQVNMQSQDANKTQSKPSSREVLSYSQSKTVSPQPRRHIICISIYLLACFAHEGNAWAPRPQSLQIKYRQTDSSRARAK